MAKPGAPVADVLQHQRREHQVDAAIREEVERPGEVRNAHFRASAGAPACVLHHARARVDRLHPRAVVEQPLGVRAWAAARVQHALAGDVGEERQRAGALVVGVVRLGVDLRRVGVGEGLVGFEGDRGGGHVFAYLDGRGRAFQWSSGQPR
jgi:hypothetical protein